MTLSANNLSVLRGGHPVLSDVSFQLGDSGGVAIVGPNGAGKTSLLLTLLGLLRPVSGRVQLGGRDVGHIRRREVARRMAYVPQSVDGFEGFSVEQIVAAGRYPHRHPLEPLTTDDHRIVAEAMSKCGVSEFARRSLETLSGGERQRVWLAAALSQHTPVLLLDEPAASLDPRHQLELVRLIRSLTGGGRLVVTVVHDLNIAAAIAHRIIALRAGHVVYDGSTGNFLTTARLAEVYEAPFSVWPRSDNPSFVSTDFHDKPDSASTE